MCCSVSPNVEVKFSDTILYAAEVVNSQDKIVHVLGYQNRAQNNVSRFNSVGLWQKIRGLFVEPTANAMLLPFPCWPGTMSQANVLKTEDCPYILKNIASAIRPPMMMPTLSFGAPRSQSRAIVEIFEAAGIYTVVLAQDARDIPAALSRVPKEKRPALNPKLFEAYAEWYPDWTFALCCFNNEKAQEALPLLWWYEPMNPEKLFLPALDSHTGDIPDFNSNVLVDHTLAVGSSLAQDNLTSETSTMVCPTCQTPAPGPDIVFCLNCGSPVQKNMPGFNGGYRSVYYAGQESIPLEIKPYLLSQVMGGAFMQGMPNGDFICQIEEVRKGIWNPVRTLPKV